MVDLVPNKKLKIGWSWGTEDGWLLHRTIKDQLWKALGEETLDLKSLISILQIKESWLDVGPEDKVPINYYLLLFAWKNYKKIYRKLKPPLLYRLGIDKICIFVLTLYKEDSAYVERIGGIVQYIMDNSEDWPKGDKEARLLALQDVKKWWWEEDWRTREKPKLAKLFDRIIYEYETNDFVRNSIDYWVDTFIQNKDKWNRADGFFNPEKWYPRGKGQCNYLVHGRMT